MSSMEEVPLIMKVENMWDTEDIHKAALCLKLCIENTLQEGKCHCQSCHLIVDWLTPESKERAV